MENPDEPVNEKTINAWHFVPKFFTEFARNGYECVTFVQLNRFE